MANFSNRRAIVPAVKAPDGRTFEGGAGYSRPARTELFLLAGTDFAEDTYYESKDDRQLRLANLVRSIVNEQGGWLWLGDFVKWLRNDAGMRSVSIMVAAEAVNFSSERVDQGGLTPRQMVGQAMVRADEPAEMLGYWLSVHGRKMPSALRRGIADAAIRLYNERNVLRYDRSGSQVRMGDVIDLTHPVPGTPQQSALFRYLLDNRHRRDDVALDLLHQIAARTELEKLTPAGRHAWARAAQSDEDVKTVLTKAMAGQWEWLKSWLGQS